MLDNFLTPETDLIITGVLKGQKDKNGQIYQEDQLSLAIKDDITFYPSFVEWEDGSVKAHQPYPSDAHNFWPTMQASKIPKVQFEKGEAEVKGLQAYIAISPEGGVASVWLAGSSKLPNGNEVWSAPVNKKVLPTIPDSDGNFSIQENEIGSKKELEVSASGNEVFGFYWSQSDGPYLFRKP